MYKRQERFCGDGEQTLRFAEQNNAIAYLAGIKRDMGIELSPPAFTTPLGYTYHIGDRISSIELDHIAAVGVIARVDEDHVWHTLPNVPGQEPVSIDRNSFERYLDTRYFEVSEPEPPVSYTHLDVYKRQGQTDGRGAAGARSRPCGRCLFRKDRQTLQYGFALGGRWRSLVVSV